MQQNNGPIWEMHHECDFLEYLVVLTIEYTHTYSKKIWDAEFKEYHKQRAA